MEKSLGTQQKFCPISNEGYFWGYIKNTTLKNYEKWGLYR